MLFMKAPGDKKTQTWRRLPVNLWIDSRLFLCELDGSPCPMSNSCCRYSCHSDRIQQLCIISSAGCGRTYNLGKTKMLHWGRPWLWILTATSQSHLLEAFIWHVMSLHCTHGGKYSIKEPKSRLLKLPSIAILYAVGSWLDFWISMIGTAHLKW